MNDIIHGVLSDYTTPYFPVVGLVNPDVVNANFLQSVFESLETGIRPDHDKARRWGNSHSERIVPELCQSTDTYTYVVTRNKAAYHGYLYTRKPGVTVGDVASKTPPQKAICFSNNDDQNAHATEAFLHNITRPVDSLSANVTPITRFEARHLIALDDGAELSGFAFLGQQILEDTAPGDTLGYFLDNALVGAIGPIQVQDDASGRKTLLPPYFGIQPEVRNKGVGSQLWQSAMAHAFAQSAQYVVLQAETGSAAQAFYRKNDLRSLGIVYVSSLA